MCNDNMYDYRSTILNPLRSVLAPRVSHSLRTRSLAETTIYLSCHPDSSHSLLDGLTPRASTWAKEDE